MNNLAEFKAGTNPTNAAFVLRFLAIAHGATGGIDLQWANTTNRAYILQRAGSLNASFVDIATDLSATPQANSYADVTALESGPYFYRLQLQEGTPSAFDGDLNGLPDEWERHYYERIRTDPLADTDGDGMNSLAEYHAGTDPTDASSRLRILSVNRVPQGGVLLTWSSVVNKSYTILRSTQPQTGFGPIESYIPATPPVNSLHDPGAAVGVTYYYSVMVDQ